MFQFKFIVFEGLDGSGKSTQASLLAHALQQKGAKVWLTAEPTTGDMGQLIRQIFKGKKNAHPSTITTLFAADRLEHIWHEQDGLLKKIKEEYIVICDRYYFSSFAYHSVHVPMDWVMECNTIALQSLRPDLNIYIDLPPEKCMQRINDNRTSVELYETLDNLKTVQQNYFAAFEKLSQDEKVIKINGEGNEQEVHQKVWEALINLK